MNNFKHYKSCDRIISISMSKERPKTPFVVTKNIYWTTDEERKMKVDVEVVE